MTPSTPLPEQGGKTRKELERLYQCVVYDRIDDVDRKEMWIKEVGIVVEKLSAIDRKQHELDVIDRLESLTKEKWGQGGESWIDGHEILDFVKAERERLGK